MSFPEAPPEGSHCAVASDWLAWADCCQGDGCFVLPSPPTHPDTHTHAMSVERTTNVGDGHWPCRTSAARVKEPAPDTPISSDDGWPGPRCKASRADGALPPGDHPVAARARQTPTYRRTDRRTNMLAMMARLRVTTVTTLKSLGNLCTCACACTCR